MRKKYFMILLASVAAVLSIALQSCGSVKDCDKIGGEFYNCLKTRQFSSVVQLIDEDALKATPADSWVNGLITKDQELGALLNVERINFETLTKDRVTTVGIKYKAIYSAGETFEKLEFIERGDRYWITYYQFNEDSTLVY